MIALIDYDMGNLKSVENAVRRIGYQTRRVSETGQLSGAHAMILPGVGAFGDAMEALREKGLAQEICDFIASGKPFLGICLGFQLLFQESEEAACIPGLGVLKGKVRKFPQIPGLKIPHMGWNEVVFKKEDPLFEMGFEREYFYFVHSYYVDPDDENIILGRTDYQISFCSAVCKDNIIAMQFHPEKSQKKGLDLLKAFFNRFLTDG